MAEVIAVKSGDKIMMSIAIQDGRYDNNKSYSRDRLYLTILNQNGLNFRRFSYNVAAFNINDIECQGLIGSRVDGTCSAELSSILNPETCINNDNYQRPCP